MILIRQAGGCSRQRGFTLIELAIALAVVGLLLAASLIPLRALDEIRQLEDEKRRLEVIRDAVVGYALRHRTRARTIKFAVVGGGIWEFRLSAGRPYLPCPDWDGDGFEDRLPEGAGGFVQGVEAETRLAVTATIQYGGFANDANWISLREDVVSGVLVPREARPHTSAGRPYGECRVSRGAVPWRTLGVPPADGWGNRHTYFADQAFSNAIFGFDRQTIADIYDSRLPDAPGFSPSLRTDRDLYNTGWLDVVPVPLESRDCPAAICDGGRAGDCVAHNLMIFSGLDLSILRAQCGWTEWNSLILKAGTSTQGEVSDGLKRFPPGSVTDGLPFVLVSHGPNGRFAVRHWASLSRPVDSRGLKSPVCNFAWARRNNIPRPHYAAHRDELGLAHEAVNGARLSPSNENCPPVHRWFASDSEEELRPNLSFFVWEPPGPGALGPDMLANRDRPRLGFDDVLLWMTREELALAVPGSIPPLPRMVVVAYFP